MPTKKTKKLVFRYRAQDPQGKARAGRANAPSAEAVRKLLDKRGYTITSITEEKRSGGIGLFGRVKVRDRSIMYRELSTMLKAGVSITEAIDILAESPNKTLKKVLSDIAASLQNGFALSVAMAGHPKVFPAVEIGVVKAGEATGNLAKVLMDLAESAERSAEFIGRVRGALIYPAFIVVVMMIVGVVIMIKVIPPIKEIFTSTQSELPAATVVLLAITDFLVHRWWLAILILIALIGLWRLFVLTKKGQQVASAIGLNFPVFGMLNRQVFLARFNRTMTLLIMAGVPIIEAVKIVSDSTSNVIFRRSLEGLIHSLEQGAAISTSLRDNKYFPKLMTQLLYIGQQSGDLGGTTNTLAGFYESEVDAKLRTFQALLEPFIILVLGGVVGFIVLAVLQPIYNLSASF